jgi:hypothetical protein
MPVKGGTHTTSVRLLLSKQKLGSKNPTKRLDVRQTLSSAAKDRWNNTSKKKRLAEGQRLVSAAKKFYATREGKKQKLQQSKKLRGENNPAKRLEVREKISRGRRRAWRNKEVRKRTIAAMQKSWDENYDERVKVNRSPKTRAKISKTMKGRDPVGRPRGPRTVWYRGNCGRIAMRSEPEVVYAKILDKKGIKWLYEPNTFCVVVDGVLRTWTPDFYLSQERRFVEIKGWLQPDQKKKILKVIEHYNATDFELKVVKDVRYLKQELVAA